MAPAGNKTLENLLSRILANKREELEHAKRVMRLEELKAVCADRPQPPGFKAALEGTTASHRIIAEIKRISPGTGFCRKEFDPLEIARGYRDAGAACLSVLTDTVFFGGSLNILSRVAEASGLPCLRKDFIVDPYQLYEARAYGASAALIMTVNFSSPAEVRDICGQAAELGLDVLLEIHEESDLEYIPDASVMAGINNRDFKSDDLKVDLKVSRTLTPLVKERGNLLVSESGIKSADHMKELERVGVDAFLIGSAFMEKGNPGMALKEFLGG